MSDASVLLQTFLSRNNLLDLQQKLVRFGVTLDILKLSNENDIRELSKILNLHVIQRLKFINACKTLKHTKNDKPIKNSKQLEFNRIKMEYKKYSNICNKIDSIMESNLKEISSYNELINDLNHIKIDYYKLLSHNYENDLLNMNNELLLLKSEINLKFANKMNIIKPNNRDKSDFKIDNSLNNNDINLKHKHNLMSIKKNNVLKAFETEIKEYKTRINKLTEKTNKCKNKIKNVKNETLELKNKLKKSHEESNEQINGVEDENQQPKDDLSDVKEEMKTHEENNVKPKLEITNEELMTANDEKEVLKKLLFTKQQQLLTLEEELKTYQQETNQLKLLLKQKESEYKKKEKELLNKMDFMTEEKNNLTNNAKLYQNNTNNLQNNFETKQQMLLEKQNKIMELKNSNNQFNIMKLQKEIRTNENDQKLSNKQNELVNTKQLLARYENENKKIKLLLQNKQNELNNVTINTLNLENANNKLETTIQSFQAENTLLKVKLGNSNKNNTLYIENLPLEVTETELFELFSSFGCITFLSICQNLETNESIGCGYITYSDHSEAEKAMNAMNLQNIRGRKCNILWESLHSNLMSVSHPFPSQLNEPIPSIITDLSVPMIEEYPLTSTMLAEADPSERKRLIGERLFPRIQQNVPRLAGKITGMLLEMDNRQLLQLLQNKQSLMKKVNEALGILRDHRLRQSQKNRIYSIAQRTDSQNGQSIKNEQFSLPITPNLSWTNQN